ncbi:hypothetical protein [Streptomyces aurantiogriseus]|uniref:Uncharacterized protein n=1 Tax=Streptomyces aurantiogriseus TaxID=66870 RepID=A0A918CJP0_9ACTN|nr:hypothetical protein [Streptomyces aurantiogriseus]GGR28010.1 hypothetical protein GCM10010251_50080 [Streptomyces aurantiogriseus]
MTDRSTAEWWALLPPGIRAEADGYVLQDARLQAVRAVWEAGRARGLGLTEAQLVVHDRYLHHGDRIARTPDSPLDLESLTARAAGAPGRVVAVEAVWDGDTVHDWFVDLVAVTADPEGELRLATIHWSAAVRHLGDEDPAPRHPAAAVADRVGRALADHLSVPFHFASPDTPDDEAPRWRP